MRDTIIRFVSMLTIPILLLLYFTFFAGNRGNPFDEQRLPSRPPQRIISFAPNITEILFELGKGDNVIGVTQFCKYPPEAAAREKIGGNVDHNYEAILRLRPDFAIILREQVDVKPFLDKHSIRYITIGSESVGEIIDAIRLISKATFVQEKGDSIAQSLRRQLADMSTIAADTERPKVLFCVSRDDIRSGVITKVFAPGTSSFYNDLIKAAGGVNVLDDVEQPYPVISAEAIIRLNPDIIVDISASYLRPMPEAVRGDWRSLKNVSAVSTGRVYCLSGDYLMIPGPRFGLILEDLRSIFAPLPDAPVQDVQ
ncbi:MAG: helical backbone metal receptor [Chitinispirillia bacterium]|nr:helical backbone metal receptor [Chitinispirillia bacterium]MCL2268005.1 helical backbone metal receptor [Chitinispirillia bacterium]